jgi:hypothetical protein
MNDDEADALAKSVSKQMDELWGHVPPGEQPGDDDELLLRTDAHGNVIVRWGTVTFHLREGAGWVHRPVPTGQEVSCYRDGRLVERAVAQDTSLN